MAQVRKLNVVIGGDIRQLGQALDRAGKKLGGFGKKVGKVAAVGAAAMGALVTAGAVGAFKLSDAWQKATRKIAVATGATGDNLSDLEDDFAAALGRVPASMDDVADALGTLSTLTGDTGEDLQDVTVAVADAARMLGEDIPGAAEAAGKALKQFGVPAGDQVDVMDGLFKLTQDYGVSLTGLATKLTKFGPIMSNAGFSISETADMFARLESAGINVNRVMPAVNSFFRRMAAEGVTDLRGALEDSFTSIRDAKTETEALAKATETFGAEGAARMTRAIRDGVVSLDDLAAQMEGTSGLIEDTAESTATLGEKWGEIKNRVAAKIAPALAAAFGGILDGMDALGPVMDKVAGWVSDTLIPAFRKVVDMAKSVVAAFRTDGLGGAFTVIGEQISDFAPKLGAMLADLGGKLVAWIGPQIPPLLAALADLGGRLFEWVAAQAGPFAQKLVDLGRALVEWVGPQIPPLLEELGKLLGAALTWLGDNADDLVTKLLEWGEAFVEWVAPLIPPMLEELGKLLGKLGVWIVTDFAPGLVKVLASVAGAIGAAALGWIGEATAGLPGRIAALVGTLGAALKAIPGRVASEMRAVPPVLWGWVVDGVKAAPRKVADLALAIGRNFKAVNNEIGTRLAGVASAIWAKLIQLGKDIVRGIIAGIAQAPQTIASAIADRIPGGGTVKRTVKRVGNGARSLFRFDQGGTVPGPRGAPNLVVAHGGETILPTHRGRGAPVGRPTGGGATTGAVPMVTVNINGPVLGSPLELGRAVVDALREVNRSDGAIPVKVA